MEIKKLLTYLLEFECMLNSTPWPRLLSAVGSAVALAAQLVRLDIYELQFRR